MRNVCTFPLKTRLVGIFFHAEAAHARVRCMLALARHGGQPRTWEREMRTGLERDQTIFMFGFSGFALQCLSVVWRSCAKSQAKPLNFSRVGLCLHQCFLVPDSTCRLMAQPSRTLLTNMHLTGSGREMTVFISPMILRLP